jgi:hypothetical protein
MIGFEKVKVDHEGDSLGSSGSKLWGGSLWCVGVVVGAAVW